MFSKSLVIFGVVTLAVLCAPDRALAQEDDGPVDIDVGSSRIGGPGTSNQRKQDAAWDAAAEEEAMPMTEESLPKKGDKKRIPALHKMVKQFWGGKMWKDICEKYDQIVEEGGPEGLDVDPEAKTKAHRAYFECAQIAFFTSDYDLTERLLKKSEKYGPAEGKHAAIRHKMLREQYRKAMGNGDVAGSLGMFKKYQAEQADEDERIWMGEEIAKLAWTAYTTKNKIELKEYMKYAEDVAPMNTSYRKLKEKIEGEENVLPNILKLGGGAILILLLGTQLAKWRERAKVKAAGGQFSDGADEEV